MILRVCLCIPTYNNPQTIESVVLDALATTSLPILVVDDGSEKPVKDLLFAIAIRTAQEQGRLRVLRLEQNQGKGIALQTAIKDCVARGFTHLLAIDADGQHLTSEIPKVLDVAKKYPWDLVIGKRRLEGETVPGVSRFGRAFSNYWVNYQTGVQVTDSQSGFRLYPLFHLQNKKFSTKRYDFEIEVLIHLIWKGVGVREVEIDVFYPEKNERVSHFDKLWDNVRISLLNTVLVVVSLFRSRRSSSEMALALGGGVFIGCTPFFGFHTLLVAGAAFLFRLNAGFLFLGSQVSIPPLAPFLIAGSILVGHWIVGIFTGTNMPLLPPPGLSFSELLSFAGAQFGQWLLGSLVIGAVLGTLVGGATFLTNKILRARVRSANWNGRSRGGVIGNGFLKFVLKVFGRHAGYFCLCFIIPYFYLFAPKARRSLNEYWRIIRPEMSFVARQATMMKHLFRFGQTLMDRIVHNQSRTSPFQTKPHGIENILEAAKAGRGLIMLSAHVGSWDLAASLLKYDGFISQLTVVEYKAEKKAFNKGKGQAEENHLKMLAPNTNEQTIFTIHEVLSEGQPIGLMGDRPIGGRFELVSFFGRLAPFDVTAFRLAAATRAPLLSTFGFKGRGAVYDFYARPAKSYVYDPSESRETQCLRWAQEFADELADVLQRYPEQWFNFFPFWSSVPAAPPGVQSSAAPNHLAEELRRRTSSALGSEPGPKSSGESQSPV